MKIILFFVSCFFLISTFYKFFYFDFFINSIHQFKLFRDIKINLYSGIGIIIIELILSICLAIGFKIKIVSYIGILLMLFFIMLFIRTKLRKEEINCGCLGPAKKNTNIKLAISRNIILIIIFLFLILKCSYKERYDFLILGFSIFTSLFYIFVKEYYNFLKIKVIK